MGSGISESKLNLKRPTNDRTGANLTPVLLFKVKYLDGKDLVI